ncbi:TolC family protein [Flavobacterium sp. MAH-1]|uniref:TolC family protein n=1 Tax=Flavobacterium agri TaxID=2743471 RepID=A0A7Y8Y441_9FLAO|nr:TolC family protein [Flavobacterium agri]NUY82152.1 TolC family protein [Flavobacterium agri]NYA72176.1 TolC family protein [Flavobacterium agri]
MKISKILALALLFLGASQLQAQKKSLSLNEAVKMAVTQSNQSVLADTKVNTANFETQSVKMNQYPDLKISGQYLRLTNADITLKSSGNSNNEEGEGNSTPKVNQLILGQASLSMPIYSGGKLRNSIKASENRSKAELATAAHSKEEVAMEVVQYYVDLYKVQKSIELLRESLKSQQQRVKDFTGMEENGLIARNDLLKAQLAESRVQLSLDEAEKNERVINYYLVTLLKLPAGTQMQISPDNIDRDIFAMTLNTEDQALQNRKDLEALNYSKKASEDQIKVAKADYYPSLSLTGGYIAADLENVVRVENAMNIGVGLSYNLSSIFKNGKAVKAAKSRTAELEQQQAILTDEIKEEVMKSNENYQLSLKQDKVYNEAVGQADENYRIVKDKYENGLADTNDLLEADVDDLNAKINVAYSKANIVLKYYELLEANGQLTQSFKFN